MFASLNIILHCHGYASIIHSLFTSLGFYISLMYYSIFLNVLSLIEISLSEKDLPIIHRITRHGFSLSTSELDSIIKNLPLRVLWKIDVTCSMKYRQNKTKPSVLIVIAVDRLLNDSLCCSYS